MEVGPGPQEYMSALLSGYDITADLLPKQKNIPLQGFNIELRRIDILTQLS